MRVHGLFMGFVAAASLCLSTAAARAEPAFDAFKQLCIDTSGEYRAVLSAADANGWQPVEVAVPEMKGVVVSDKLTRSRTLGGGDATLSAWTGKTANDVMVSTCTVQVSRGDYGAALAQVRGWAGFAPQDTNGQKVTFRFMDQGGARKALAPSEYDAAAAGSGMVILTVNGTGGGVNLDLLKIKK